MTILYRIGVTAGLILAFLGVGTLVVSAMRAIPAVAALVALVGIAGLWHVAGEVVAALYAKDEP